MDEPVTCPRGAVPELSRANRCRRRAAAMRKLSFKQRLLEKDDEIGRREQGVCERKKEVADTDLTLSKPG